MPKDEYSWTKEGFYHVRTEVDDDVKEGDEIVVDSKDGGSKQKVLSATIMYGKSGKPVRKVLLLKEISRSS